MLPKIIEFIVQERRMRMRYFGGYYYEILKRDKSRFLSTRKGVLLSAVRLVDYENWRIIVVALQHFIRCRYFDEETLPEICKNGPHCRDASCTFIHA